MRIYSDKCSGRTETTMFYKVAVALLAVVLVSTAMPLQAEPEKNKAKPKLKPKAKPNVNKATDEANNNLHSLFFVLGASKDKIADIALKSNAQNFSMALFSKQNTGRKYFQVMLLEGKVQFITGYVSFNEKNRQTTREIYRQIIDKGKVISPKKKPAGKDGETTRTVVDISTTSGIVRVDMEYPESKTTWYFRVYYPHRVEKVFYGEKSSAKAKAKTTTKELAKILKMPIALGTTKAEFRKIVIAGDFNPLLVSHLGKLKLYLSKDKYIPISVLEYSFGKDGLVDRVAGGIGGLKKNKKNEEALKALIQQIKTYEKHELSSDKWFSVVVPQPYLESKKAMLSFGPLPIFDKKHKNEYPSVTISVHK